MENSKANIIVELINILKHRLILIFNQITTLILFKKKKHFGQQKLIYLIQNLNQIHQLLLTQMSLINKTREIISFKLRYVTAIAIEEPLGHIAVAVASATFVDIFLKKVEKKEK